METFLLAGYAIIWLLGLGLGELLVNSKPVNGAGLFESNIGGVDAKSPGIDFSEGEVGSTG